MERSEEYGALFVLCIYLGLLIWAIHSEASSGPERLYQCGALTILLLIVILTIIQDLRERTVEIDPYEYS